MIRLTCSRCKTMLDCPDNLAGTKLSCPDCGEAVAIEVRGGRPDDTSFLFHCLVPAGKWWNDILFT